MFWGYTIAVEGGTAWLFLGWGGEGQGALLVFWGVPGGMALLFWVVQHGYGGMALLFWVVQHCHFSGYSMVMVEGMKGGWWGHDQ